MGADKGKKAKVSEGEGEGEENEHIDGDLVLSIEKLQEIQDELEKVNEEASDKVLEVEQKYNEIRRPVYVRRNDIIKAIPDFWLTAFLSHPLLGDLLTEEDQKIFKHMVSLDVEDCKDLKSGYSIMLNFSENPYFENKTLTKTYSFTDEGTTTVKATPINWKEGMNIANGSTEHEKKGKKRPLVEQSFFVWFSETQDDDQGDSVQDEQIAEIIKEDLWPNPLKYFNNEADEEELEGEEGEEGSEGEDEGEEEEEEEEE
ncbi:hypothetical protein LUZ63_008689 [Rhynchospora breviuscula]|uniref:Uncharacterized protein n=1 Tax=Rhynchospora breviuscula TaxID=2022672 RepID=A0A9Q0CUW9_9POAL|nr:hypothetical protein LUZ63_008689 [Rhynchospora breviuscula]